MTETYVDLERLSLDGRIGDDNFNENKVERIREAWKGGKYSPDSKVIAGHLVEWLRNDSD